LNKSYGPGNHNRALFFITNCIYPWSVSEKLVSKVTLGLYHTTVIPWEICQLCSPFLVFFFLVVAYIINVLGNKAIVHGNNQLQIIKVAGIALLCHPPVFVSFRALARYLPGVISKKIPKLLPQGFACFSRRALFLFLAYKGFYNITNQGGRPLKTHIKNLWKRPLFFHFLLATLIYVGVGVWAVAGRL